MIEVKISDKLKEICPNITLGCIQASVKVGSSSESLLKELNKYCEDLTEKISLEDISSLPKIRDTREVYKKLGKSPSKYRVSSEALMRRILQKKGIYKINNIVEINNLISLKSCFSVGSYNVKNIQSPICLTIGEEGEKYKGIGKDLINIESLPVLSDAIGTFGSPTSDSERAMITNDVNEIIMCIYSFSGREDLEKYLKYAKELLEMYADAKSISVKVIEN